MIKVDEKQAKLTINVRYPIKSSAHEVYKGIRNSLSGTGIKLIEE